MTVLLTVLGLGTLTHWYDVALKRARRRLRLPHAPPRRGPRHGS